jgi:prepilin-type N-terminal cleavage/methylation domain-containing protein
MKLNNKGFSLVELLGVMVVLGVVLTMAIGQYRKYIYQTIQESYDLMAQDLETASENYFIDHPLDTSVTIEELVEQEYIEPVNDPSREADDDDTCQGKIRKKTTEATEDGALDLDNLSVSICCKDYNYTYKYPDNEKSQDKYCKAYPYDLKKINNIRVLNVYPNPTYANYVDNWMKTYGKGIINVTPVYIDEFNKTPGVYLGKKGNWNYDEIVFGFCDANNNKDLSPEASALVDEFLGNGGAAVFGHDTLTVGRPNFQKLADYLNITFDNNTDWQKYSGTKVTIKRAGVFTEYPYKIGDLGSELTIPLSHVYRQVAHGDVWLTFSGISDPTRSIYLSTWGNNALIQTGHSSGQATADEQKIIANIIFYMVAKQYVEDE